MKAVFRHELSSAFTSLTAYVFGGFVLLFTGIYTMAYNLKGGCANFEYVLGSMSFVFLIIVPILTMRVLAEERHQKTDQLLYSLPLTMTQVVLGKFFALAVVFLAISFVVYYMTKSGLGATILAALLEGGLLAAYLGDTSKFEGLFPNLIGKLSLFERFYELINGIFDLGTIVYYLSVMAVFLFLTVQAMEKRRWSE